MHDRPPNPLPGATPVPPFDLTGLKTVDLRTRPSKVTIDDLGRPLAPAPAWRAYLEHLPNQLAGRSFRRLCEHLARVQRTGKMAACALGGHVIKTGCGPYLVDWLQRGVLGALALNGAAAIHDLELALAGRTSEEVAPRLLDGSFGMARETAEIYTAAATEGQSSGRGLGWALGRILADLACPYPDTSVLIQAFRHGVPCTVHVALGTDVVHMHPHIDGAALGAASLIDFRILTTVVSRLAHGLWINLGCAVILPEVFLKAVSIVRNHGYSLDGLVTANLDMIQQYRGRVNVCERPGDEGILLTGHHELLVPLVHATVAALLDGAAVEKAAGPRSEPAAACNAAA